MFTPFYFGKKKNAYIFNSKAAKAYYGIPVTTALVERFFSKTDFILRPRRCMQDDLPEKLFYSKENTTFYLKKIFLPLIHALNFRDSELRLLTRVGVTNPKRLRLESGVAPKKKGPEPWFWVDKLQSF